MFILLFVVSLAVCIASYVIYKKKCSKIRLEKGEGAYFQYKEYGSSGIENASFISLVASFAFLMIICILSYSIFTSSTIDSRISMYEEENAKIEESISTAVQGYMDFESETFTNLKDEDVISLITLYPELKSDTLVQEQMQVYLDNNAKIKELKEEKINVSKDKWLLYFGNW